jgi:hypothetical protein
LLPRELIHGRFHADDFTVFAFRRDFEWPATNFAIGRKPLAAEAGINHHFAILPTVGAWDVGELFHGANLTASGQSANYCRLYKMFCFSLLSGLGQLAREGTAFPPFKMWISLVGHHRLPTRYAPQHRDFAPANLLALKKAAPKGVWEPERSD